MARRHRTAPALAAAAAAIALAAAPAAAAPPPGPASPAGSGTPPGPVPPAARPPGPVQAVRAEALGEPDELDPAVWSALTTAYKATERYLWEPYAAPDGWLSDGTCWQDAAGSGAMGFHYVNEADVGSLDPARPGALLYEDDPLTHRRQLTGAEWIVYDRDGRLDTDDDRPTLFGVPFDGPMKGHHPGQPVHYDLHVWLWKDNPNGMFKQYNPTVSCPAGQTHEGPAP
ncbi:hypothetical protein [Streptomyces sp. NPDC089919]|uniref:hypothetical protein n=1 Tax=Streptomyces sp. NPDC089919 TaxID=3155188 RepID=UPI0034316F6A